MVYLLHAYFGRDGREEAEALLQRRSGNADNPRILGAFNERTPDWLSYFMFTHLIFALIASVLLSAGLAQAAQSFDVVAKSSLAAQTVNTVPGIPCIIEH